MQRDGKNSVAHGKLRGAGTHHPASENRREIEAVPVLEAVHQVADDAVMDSNGTQAVEGGRIGDCFRGERSLSVVVGKRRTQNFAERALNEPYRGPALRAKRTVAGDPNPTMGAGRRVNEIANECRERRKGRRS